MRIGQTGTELDKLRVERVVYTCCITLIVRTGTFNDTFLIVIVESYIISIVGTATREIYVVVHTCTCLEDLIEPIGVGIVKEVIDTIGVSCVTTGNRSTRVAGCLPDILTILVGIHHIIDTLIG